RANVDHTRGAEVGPGEFLFARPDNFDRFFGRASETRGLDGGFTGVLAAVSGAGVRHEHANAFLGNMKCGSEFFADAKGALRAGPNGKLFAVPFGERCSWFQRSVRNVGDPVGRGRDV